MNTAAQKIFCIILTSLFSSAAFAIDTAQGDLYINGYLPPAARNAAANYTLLDAAAYQQLFLNTRDNIQIYLSAMQSHTDDANRRVLKITQRLQDIPYLFVGATGESDWQSDHTQYQPGAVHLKQDPVYRLDGLDCLTFVQLVMALLHSKNINEFDQNILKIGYGAAGNTNSDIVHYYNRNNFIDGDWNAMNERNGWLSDVTAQGELANDAATTSVTLTRQNWFLTQQQNLAANVRVLSDADGAGMATRFTTVYSALNFPHFDTETVTTSYLPKEKIAIQQADGSYLPNQALLDNIPTPAVVEIVRDARKWNIGGKNIKDIIGSELSISHMGLLYRTSYQHGDLIYRKTTCSYDAQHIKVCAVTPVYCQKAQCDELMFVHATDARPNGYYWYQQANGDYACTAIAPPNAAHFTQCNRVEQQPLFTYLTDYQYGTYLYMTSPSIIGVHIEKLNDV